METIKQKNQPLEEITNKELENCKRPLKLLLYATCLFAANYALQESDIAPYVVEQAANVVTGAGACGLLLHTLYNLYIHPYMRKNLNQD